MRLLKSLRSLCLCGFKVFYRTTEAQITQRKEELSKQNSGVRSQNNASGTLREQHEFCTTGG
ncbi:hypothetical protein [Nostoc sp.]|uniref:hypothetical protein n=1 Tax=Nostoc sp. TaxID=1180 RepID=UPI002FF51331